MVTKEELMKKLVEEIAEKTGYPQDGIVSTMSLESDLGVDSIGKVEILSSISDQYGVDWDNLDDDTTEKLGNLHTIDEIVNFFVELAA